MQKYKKLSFKLLLFVFLSLPTFASAQTLKPGDLVKSESSVSVYQIQADSTRLVFPSEAVYRSHYDSFDKVKTVSFDEIKKYQFVGNVSFKVGTLIKFDINPKVYQVKINKELEWIKTEEGFNSLGYEFSQVIRVPETSFGNYQVRTLSESHEEVLKRIKDNFVHQDKIEDIEKIASSTRGLVEALGDEYSVFWSKEEYSEFLQWLDNDSFQGIGAQIELNKGQLTIVAPLNGSPAKAAGLLPGDEVMFIDDYDTTNITLTKAVMLIRGPKGEKVVLHVKRNSSVKLTPVTITRDTIVVQQFEWRTEETLSKKNIAYLSLSQFSLSAWQNFAVAKEEILASEPDGMILDLRNNPGGYLHIALDMANKWLPPEVSIMKEQRANSDRTSHVSNNQEYYLDMPLVVLVNKGSASASEIVAGALQDNKVATIIGEQTFGKGVVQEVMPLSDGNVMKLTISEWFTPDGRQINGKGITPDIIVEVVEGKDMQLERALEELDNIIK